VLNYIQASYGLKSPEAIAKECGVSVETIYVYLAKFGLRKSKR